MENLIRMNTKRTPACLQALMKSLSQSQKENKLMKLHMLASKRLTQDNAHLVAQGEEQKIVVNKMNLEKNAYFKQAIGLNQKVGDDRHCWGGVRAVKPRINYSIFS